MFLSQAGAQPRMWEASPSEHKKWVEVFKACDEDNKGYLSREDFKVAIVMLFGYKPSKIEADSVMSSVEPNTSGIVLKEFLSIVRKKKEAQVYWNEIRHIFTAFDRHYRGYLTLEDFKKAFRQVAPKLPERIILEVFREVDQDSDDHVSFKDFEYAMNYGQNYAGVQTQLRKKTLQCKDATTKHPDQATWVFCPSLTPDLKGTIKCQLKWVSLIVIIYPNDLFGKREKSSPN
uniref:EF-hand calcium-binding domain-containing protein 11 n=1 Tax=Sus scrofa TaxID=9823 RepID=A0A4X1SV92_PIG